jgi:hypothetical protein
MHVCALTLTHYFWCITYPLPNSTAVLAWRMIQVEIKLRNNLQWWMFQALICLVDKKTGDKSKTRPRFVKQDQVAIMRVECAGVICMEQFKLFPQMGRFTLRDEGDKYYILREVLSVMLCSIFWVMACESQIWLRSSSTITVCPDLNILFRSMVYMQFSGFILGLFKNKLGYTW